MNIPSCKHRTSAFMAGALFLCGVSSPWVQAANPPSMNREADPPKPVPHVAMLPGGKKIVKPVPPRAREAARSSNTVVAPSFSAPELEPTSESSATSRERSPVAPRSPQRQPEFTRNSLPASKSAEATATPAQGVTGLPITQPAATPSQPAPSSTDLPSATPSSTMTPQLLSLQTKLRRVLTSYVPRRLNSREHDCWETMHAVIAYGLETEIHRDGPGGKLVNGAGWLCFNGSCQNYRLLYVDEGRVMARQGVGVQGHFGQFLAILAQSQMPLSYPMLVEGQEFTVGDLLESEKLTCQTGMELTFKLIAVTKYSEDLEERWQNKWNETWSVEKLVKEELAAPIRGAACGGTHRLTGLAYAVRRREQLEQPIDGEFARAKKFLDDYHRYTFSLQNRDGSFSTEWFRGPGARPDLGRRLQTTGHILEWLVFSLPERELTDPRVVRAVDYLTSIMAANPEREWEIGPLGHAIHALQLYNERVFVAQENAQELARERLSDRSDAVRRAAAKVDPTTGDSVEE